MKQITEDYIKIRKILALAFIQYLEMSNNVDIPSVEFEDIMDAFAIQDWARLMRYFEKYNKKNERKPMTLLELRDKIDKIIQKTPSWANVSRIGIVTNRDETGFCDMEWLENFGSFCCDGQGMVAFQLVMEGDKDYTDD